MLQFLLLFISLHLALLDGFLGSLVGGGEKVVGLRSFRSFRGLLLGSADHPACLVTIRKGGKN